MKLTYCNLIGNVLRIRSVTLGITSFEHSCRQLSHTHLHKRLDTRTHTALREYQKKNNFKSNRLPLRTITGSLTCEIHTTISEYFNFMLDALLLVRFPVETAGRKKVKRRHCIRFEEICTFYGFHRRWARVR